MMPEEAVENPMETFAQAHAENKNREIADHFSSAGFPVFPL